MMDPDRAKLQVAAVIGALLGIVTGYVVGHPLYGILIWGLIGDSRCCRGGLLLSGVSVMRVDATLRPLRTDSS